MFKTGDKVYHYRFGIVFTRCGRRYSIDKYPSVITLEKAEKMGLVRKKVTAGKLRVKYRDTITKNDLHVTEAKFKDVGSFFEANAYYAASEFVSFVDDQLRDCPPPQETVEWEEIV
jgi:hypothetical protein